MDKEKAISSFQYRTSGFAQLLLVTDAEVEELFGEEVARAVTELDTFNHKEGVCLSCQGKCCREIGCEFYAPAFDGCPIHQFRPIACRLHFCNHFDAADRSLVVELRDVFFGSFMTLDVCPDARLRALDGPPFASVAPELAAACSSSVERVRQGTLRPEEAEKLIRREVEKYRGGFLAGGSSA